MAKFSKKYITIIIMAVAVVGIWGMKTVSETTKSNGAEQLTFTKVKGPETAPITIIEYIDFQCPACAEGAKFLKTYMEQHPGRIRLELKHYPLTTVHRNAFMASRYAECALNQDVFWPFHDLLIERQKSWHNLVDAKPAFHEIAEELNLDLHDLQVCLDGEELDEEIMMEKISGRDLDVRSTPTYFINGTMVVGMENLKRKLTELGQ